MFSSLFSTSPPVDPTAPTFHPVSERFKQEELFGELTAKDTEWLCAGGFVTETQIFYTITDDGTFIMCQVIHSSVGMWYPTIQFTCKIFNPKSNETIWKSVNVSNFTTPPPGLDKRSSKADEFSITYKPTSDPDHPESYTVRANLGQDLQVFLEVRRPAAVPGFKVGNGDKGGYSYFGSDIANPEGYVIHRFWPRFNVTGQVVKNGHASSIQGSGMFVHAIQGMRPNLVASRWNFAYFQSDQAGGVSAIQMEFTTLPNHGLKGAGSGGLTVNVGSLVFGGKLACVTAQTKAPHEESSAVYSRATHLNTILDPDTSYQKPSQLLFEWSGSSLIKDSPGAFKGRVEVDVGDVKNPKGLIEKVDVLAEIPYVIKMAVNYVAGTKPYIYQWFNPAKLSITDPDNKTTEIEGSLYNEATFIS